ncbi:MULTISPECIES: VOC family protein [Allobacillus]|uniref:VOC family protein n=1 Tax=Allobacillus salarius TaxID=1955272 RepID=A0A556P8L1_9BACI|nr:VOC family protein [Allobacillus salarius]TSJ60722.1 VOC family protein [Allobacillus salarius]
MVAFDHLVILSNDPAKDASAFENNHQLQAVQGGEHKDWGTYNHLAFMKNNSYVEWIGIRNQTLAKKSGNPLIQHTVHASEQQTEGPIQFALRVENIDRFIDHFETEGIAYKGPFPGRRVRADGSVLEWRMLFPTYSFDEAPLPFLIEWSGEGNQPTDRSQINETSFSKVVVFAEHPQEYRKQLKNVYRLPTNSKSIFELDNGMIEVKQGEQIEGHFNTIQF